MVVIILSISQRKKTRLGEGHEAIPKVAHIENGGVGIRTCIFAANLILSKDASADGSDLIASVFCSFPTRPAFTCTEIIKLTRGWSGRNADTIAFRK